VLSRDRWLGTAQPYIPVTWSSCDVLFLHIDLLRGVEPTGREVISKPPRPAELTC